MRRMNKNNNKLSIALHIMRWAFLTLFISGSTVTLASNLYSIEPYIDFSTQEAEEVTWLPPIVNTTRDNELFFTNANGEIYRSQGEIVGQSPVINLSQHIETQKNVTFTALTLHPSFHLLDQEGSNIIYTAHIEEFDPSIKKVRLYNDDIKKNHAYDAVITEWQLSDINNNQVNTYKQREVLRIATPSVDVNINQLSFNPYLKPWSDDFGLLYISFKYDEQLKNSALYSGSILRIKPNKFGLKNYTIPLKNPFIKNPNIKDEVVILGAQKIQQFTWSKKAKNQLIVTHQYNENQLISGVSTGSNYLLTEPFDIIYKRKAQDSLLSTAYYRGKELSSLWNKVLFIEKSDKKWQLSATKISKEMESEQLSTLALSLNEIDSSNQLALYITHKNEVLLWDQTKAIIYKVLLNSAIANESEAVDKSSQENNSNTLLYSLLIFFFIIMIILYIKNQYNQTFIKNKSLLRANLARFNFDIKTNEITLFKRHETKVNTNISTTDVISSEVYLNNTLINTITVGNGNEFDLQKENLLRLNFEQEHRDKMVDDKVRQIILKITTVKAEKYNVCVYLREGNQRFTKEKYHNVIDQIIDWNWYFSSIINPDETPTRPIKEEPDKRRPVTLPKVTKTSVEKSKHLKTEANTTSSSVAATKIKKGALSKENSNVSKAQVDTKLIEALNKLVTLKEQGYLNEDEFNLAKANLLNSLANND